MRAHLQNMFKYLFVGGTASLVDWSIFWVFAVELEWNYLLVGGGGFLVAAGVNYWMCIRFLYESGARFSQRREVIGVYAISGIGLFFHEIILYLTVQELQIHIMWCKIFATGVVFFWNFGLRNFYLFASPRQDET